MNETRLSNTIYIIGNALPVAFNAVLYMLVSQRNISVELTNFWTIINAIIIPAYLLAFNFILYKKFFSVRNICLIIFVELACLFHLTAYYQFSRNVVRWWPVLVIAISIIATGGFSLCLVSNYIRRARSKNCKSSLDSM